MFNQKKQLIMKMLKARITVLSFMVFAFSLLALNACKDDDPTPVAPAAPVLNVASEITATGFKVSWTAVPNADKYLLDVSLVENFATTVTGYAKKEVTGTSHAVTGLTAGTKYYFQLFAKDGSLTSSASVKKDATTLP
jgi:hypothetical protein